MGLNLSLNKHVAWGKLLTYSVPQFLHLQGIHNNISILLFRYLFSRDLLTVYYCLPSTGDSGVSQQTYRRLTVNSQGHFSW